MPVTPTQPDSPAETLLSPAQVAFRLGRGAMTVRDWIRIGIHLPNGSRVRLRATRLGGRWLIRLADVETFQDRCASGAMPDGWTPETEETDTKTRNCPLPRPQVNRSRSRAAYERLRAAGVVK